MSDHWNTNSYCTHHLNPPPSPPQGVWAGRRVRVDVAVFEPRKQHLEWQHFLCPPKHGQPPVGALRPQRVRRLLAPTARERCRVLLLGRRHGECATTRPLAAVKARTKCRSYLFAIFLLFQTRRVADVRVCAVGCVLATRGCCIVLFWPVALQAYRCPFPDNHPAWLAVDCVCNGGYACPAPAFDAAAYYESAPGSREDGSEPREALCLACQLAFLLQSETRWFDFLPLSRVSYSLVCCVSARSPLLRRRFGRCEYNCSACLPGSTADGVDWSPSCAACGLGGQQPLAGQDTCEACPPGAAANETGAETCAPCRQVRFCVGQWRAPFPLYALKVPPYTCANALAWTLVGLSLSLSPRRARRRRPQGRPSARRAAWAPTPGKQAPPRACPAPTAQWRPSPAPAAATPAPPERCLCLPLAACL